MPDFDCIVIGSGIGGLIAGGKLASRGYKVLIIEKNLTPGGYLQSFKRRSVTFDSSVDCFSGLGDSGPIRLVLDTLGVGAEVEPVRVDPIRTSIFPSLTVHVHSDISRYIEGIKRLFPDEREGIDGLFKTLASIYADIKDWGDYVTGLTPSERIPTAVIENGRLTYKDLLDGFINDVRLKSVLSDRCSFYGLPPAKAGAVPMAALVMSYFSSGAWRVKGGSQRLADALVKGIRAKGSEVLFRKKATEIMVDNGAAIGVRTEDKGEFTAKAVISNIDFHKTFGALLPDGSRQGLDQKTAEVSSSFFIAYIGVQKDLGFLNGSSSIGYYPTFDMEYNFQRQACFSSYGSIGITIPSLLDGSLAPAGIHCITAHEMAEFDYVSDWNARKGELTEKVLDKVEKVIPGVRENAVHIEAATPSTLERYTANTNGAAYGWVQAPGLRPVKTFINGLYLAGHWEGTGGGIVAAAYSGHKAAGLVEKRLG